MKGLSRLLLVAAVAALVTGLTAGDLFAQQSGWYNPVPYNVGYPWGTAGWGEANVGSGNYNSGAAVWAGFGLMGGSVGVGLGYGGQGDVTVNIPGMGDVLDFQW